MGVLCHHADTRQDTHQVRAGWSVHPDQKSWNHHREDDMIVQKWVAGFNYEGELVVVSHSFRQTPKLFIMQPSINDCGDQMACLLGYQTRFDRQQDRCKLHDTAKEAISALLSEQRLSIISAEEMIETARAHIREIHKWRST